MKRALFASAIALLFIAAVASADTFGSGANQFEIGFVTISGATNPTGGITAGDGCTFTGVANDYRIGVNEITNEQWNKFKACYGTVTGNLSYAYDLSPYWTSTGVPTNNVSWYEAAQFVNWLNTSTGHPAAYKFTGTIHTDDYAFSAWDVSDAGYDMSNPYRNSNAFYFLPTENEWVKAAYWNGAALQEYATKAGDSLVQGDGISGTGWNYYNKAYATDPYGPWNVGSGSQELNGTFDMMGNLWEWMEGPYFSGNYSSDSARSQRGGSYWGVDSIKSSHRYYGTPGYENNDVTFRVASVPEPGTMGLLAIGALLLSKRAKGKR